MDDDRYEARLERIMDRLDKLYLSGKMSREEYDRRVDALAGDEALKVYE